MTAPSISRTGPRGPSLRRRSPIIGADRHAAVGHKPKLHGAVLLLLVTWVMPFVVSVGPLRLSPYRIALIALFVPCLVWLAQGKSGRIRLPDLLIVAFAIWSLISLIAVHGGEGVQPGGIQLLETVTPYFLARCCIRSADDFCALAKILTLIAAMLLPFALYEALTGQNIYLEISSKLFPSIGITDKDPRWGLRRVQLFFEHPILMGVCLGSILALTHTVVGRDLSITRRWLKSWVTFLTAALSLSSGPLSGLIVQVALLSWNGVLRWLRSRWTVLMALIALFVLAVQLFAKRPLPNILLSFAFDPDSAFFRIIIWDYGTQSVANHPVFGTGVGPWDHPTWMAPSIDMFWLYNAIAFGLPGGILMFGFFAAACIGVGRVRGLDALHYDYRMGYLISMASFFLTGWMVHFWNGTYVFFVFMVGAGMWFRDVPVARLSSVQKKPIRLRGRFVRPGLTSQDLA